MTDERTEALETPEEAFLREHWPAIARRGAAIAAERAFAARRWEARLALANRIAIAVGVFLIAQFPLACAAFAAIERSALEYCAAL